MMEISFEGKNYLFDLEDATTEQLMKIYKTYELSLMDLARGMQAGRIDALLCVWWLIQQQNGLDLLRLEKVTLDKPVKFSMAVMAGLVKEQQELADKVQAAVKAEAAKAPKE
jgi:hypothetical protein